MADNKNMKVDDEIMATAAGGTDGAATTEPKFKMGDYVQFEQVYNGTPIIVKGRIVKIHFESFFDTWEYDIESENHPSGHPVEINIWEKHLSYA